MDTRSLKLVHAYVTDQGWIYVELPPLQPTLLKKNRMYRLHPKIKDVLWFIRTKAIFPVRIRDVNKNVMGVVYCVYKTN